MGKAVENSISVTREKWREFHLTNFKPSISLDYKNLVGGAAAEAMANYLPILDAVPKGVAAIFGLAISTLKISADIFRVEHLKRNSSLSLRICRI